MFTTNKKFFDKKNIIKNQDANSKFTMNKNDQSKSESLGENMFKEKQGIYSKPYESQDQYKELAEQFQNANFDVGYQVFQKAFPFRPNTNFMQNLTSRDPPNFFFSDPEFNPIHQERHIIDYEQAYETKQEFFVQFEHQSSTEEQENFDDEQSTRENSNHLKDQNI